MLCSNLILVGYSTLLVSLRELQQTLVGEWVKEINVLQSGVWTLCRLLIFLSSGVAGWCLYRLLEQQTFILSVESLRVRARARAQTI